MNLAFNNYGEIELNDNGSLADVDNTTAELSKLHMLIDILPGSYPYHTIFGLPYDSIVGKSNISDKDVSNFEAAINSALTDNGLLLNFDVSIEKLSNSTLLVTIAGTGSDITWLFKTKTGRLVDVTKTIPEIERVDFIATTEYIVSTGQLRYDIDYIFRKNKEQNGFDYGDMIEYSSRVFYTDIGNENISSEWVFVDYEITEDLTTLILQEVVQANKSIVIQVWPSHMSSLEAITNPFLLRK